MKKTACILIALVMLAGLISFPASSLAADSPARVLPSAEGRDALTILNDPTAEMIANAVTGVLCKDDVSLRKGPGPNHSAVKRGLDIGALVTVYAEEEGYYYVRDEESGKYGYLPMDAVIILGKTVDSPLGPVIEPTEEVIETLQYGVLNKNKVILRKGPDSDYGSVQSGLKKGATVTIYAVSEKGNFYFVRVDASGNYGYIAVKYVDLVVEPGPGPEPEPTEEPTPEPTEEPTPKPTEEPTPEPTEEPTPEPTEEPEPTEVPFIIDKPTPEPTEEPEPEPTEGPTPEPTEEPTPEPFIIVDPLPTPEPTPEPTEEPTPEPTEKPTEEPTREPILIVDPSPASPELPTPDPYQTLVTPEPTRTPEPSPTGPFTEPTWYMIENAVNGVVSRNGVNMRKGPSTKYGLAGSNIKKGTSVTVYAEDGDWYFLRIDKTGKYGYIYKDYVELEDDYDDDDPTPKPTKRPTDEPAFRLSRGDVNGDGLISAADVALILRYDAGLIDLDDVYLEAADWDGDDEVTDMDARALLRYIVERLAR